MMNSYSRNGESSQPNRNLNDSKNVTTILPPEITSTPFHNSKPRTSSPLVTPTRRILGPRRYALSSNGTFSPMKAIKDPPGPLLTSTSYNVNVSTYIDTKSPGYAGRLVQYNEETARSKQHTHQERYGSPGLFPIVHLFKKSVPVISPKLKKATVRIGTPEMNIPYSQEHKRLLLEGIVRNSPLNSEKEYSNDVSTRSVLDALKEISRKRIHASEEYEEADESNKKLKRDCLNGDGDSSKRNRVDSPQSDTSTSPIARPAVKKLCTIDAVLASKTSSMYGSYEFGNKRKSVDTPKIKVSPVNKKKFNNAETQTISTPVHKNIVTVEQVQEPKQIKEKTVDESTTTVEIVSPPKQILRVFDDKPLEVIRKNRLGALLSALTGHQIPPIEMEDRRSLLDQDWATPKPEKKLVSILSPQNKQVKSVEKHVTFDLPESSTEAKSSIPIESSSVTVEKSTKELDITEKPPAKVLSESSNDFKSDTTNKPQSSIGDGADKVLSLKSDVGTVKLNASSSVAAVNKNDPPIVGGFKFDLPKSVVPVAKDSSDTSCSANSNPLSINVSVCKESNTVDQLQKNIFVSSSNGAPSIGFSPKLTSPSQSEVSPKSSAFSLINKTPPNFSTVNSLGLPSSLPLMGSAFKGTASPTTSMFVTPQPTQSSFQSKSPLFIPAVSKAASSPSILVNTASFKTSSPALSSPMFNSATSESINSVPKTEGNMNPTPIFGTPLTSSGVSSDSITNSLTSTTSVFGLPPATSAFGTPPSLPSFSSPSNKNAFNSTTTGPFGSIVTNSTTSITNVGPSSSGSGGFNFSSGSTLPAFSVSGFAPASKASSATTIPSSSNPISSTNLPFGNNSTISFSSPTNSASISAAPNTSSIFGTTPTLNFGTSSAGASTKPFTFNASNTQPANSTLTSTNTPSMFSLKNSQSGMTLGTNTTASSASNIPFGSTPPTFGAAGSNKLVTESSSRFGQNPTVPAFGATTLPAFGATTTPAFGATTTPAFGATTTPAFGAATTPAFGTVTSASTFGTSNTLNFGTPSTSSAVFNVGVPSFGVPSTTAPTFNSSNTPFGTTSTTSSGIGASTSLNFGLPPSTSNLTFGTNTPTFGATTTSSVFGSTNTPTFGNPTTTASFGTNVLPFGGTSTTSANTFNSNNPVSPFGASSTTNGFGGFGSSTSSPFGATTSAPTFGTNTNNAFGNSTATGAFGGPSSTNNTFGISSGFGSAPNANPFGNSSSKPNTFGIGFGGTNSKPEQAPNIFTTQPNNIFNSNSTFGSNPSTNLNTNSTAPGVFTFGSPNAPSSSSGGVFAFGAGEAPKAFNFSAPGTPGSAPTSTSTGFSSFAPSNNTMPNMFNIGSGASPSQNRGRPLVRARRRT